MTDHDWCRLLQASPRTLVLFGAYSIGKERVYLQVGRELGVQIYVDRARWRMLECLSLPPDDTAMLTTESGSTRFRVVSMAHLRLDKLRELLKAEGGRYDALVAFRPSGWCLPRSGRGGAGKVIRSGDVRLHEVPYSEHSSFTELVSCVRDMRPRSVVPTVCGSAAKSRAILERLAAAGAPVW